MTAKALHDEVHEEGPEDTLCWALNIVCAWEPSGRMLEHDSDRTTDDAVVDSCL